MEIQENPDVEVLQPLLLANPSDLTLRIVECDTETRFTTDEKTNRASAYKVLIPRKTVDIHVDKEKLKIASKYFQAMFSGRWIEYNTGVVTLNEDTVKSMEVWLRLFHSALPGVVLASVAIPDLWNMVMAADKYEFERKSMNNWFRDRFTAHKADIMRRRNDDHLKIRQMLFPCYSFNYAQGFALLTKYLAYKYRGHITEHNPTKFRQMHLPRRVIQQLNAAKGRLRTILHRGLFEAASGIIKSAKCNCKEGTIFQYLRELQRIQVWPLESTFAEACIDQILARMDLFDESKMYAGNASQTSTPTSTATSTAAAFVRPSCFQCSRSWEDVVKAARKETAEYFDGLCLDCMRRKNNIRPEGDDDDDYWLGGTFCRRYDLGCRVRHKEPTWYFSFMGRREKKNLVELSDEDSD